VAAEALGVPALRDVSAADLEAAAGRLDPTLLRRARHVVSENGRVLAAVDALESGDWPALGRLVTASHESLRDDFEVSVPEVDALVDAALAAGALGARMTGGGFGGNVLALVPAGLLDDVTDAVDHRAAGDGRAPDSVVVSPVGGAQRVQLDEQRG
jgi:galactokinase